LSRSADPGLWFVWKIACGAPTALLTNPWTLCLPVWDRFQHQPDPNALRHLILATALNFVVFVINGEKLIFIREYK
jgi:hypothetical protein